MNYDIKKQEAPDIGLSSGKLLLLRIFPFATNAYNRNLRKLMDGVSEKSFRYYHSYFIGMVKLTKKNSRQFQNSKKETDSVLKQFPRLNSHRSAMFDTVKKHRQECRLVRS